MEKAVEYCLLGIQSELTCMPRADWASWVQAVFSVVAIVAAIVIAWWQRRSEHRAASARSQARAEIAGTSVLFKLPIAIGTLDSMESAVLERQIHFASRAKTLTEMIDRMVTFATDEELIAIADVDARASRFLIRGERRLRDTQTMLRMFSDHTDVPADSYGDDMAHVSRMFADSKRDFQEAMDRLGLFVPDVSK